MAAESTTPTLRTRCHSLAERANALAHQIPQIGPMAEATAVVGEAASLLVDIAARLEQLEDRR